MRVLVVHDGKAWFVRRLLSITHDLEKDHKIYRCDKHLAGPFPSILDAALWIEHNPKAADAV